MEIGRCTRADFLEILGGQAAFWGSHRALAVHHPMLIEEFGDTAFVMREGAVLCGYLFGFRAQTGPHFYIHLVAVRDGWKGRGVGRALYAHVEAVARNKGAKRLKAIVKPDNATSIAFHRALGFTAAGAEAGADAAPVVPDYAGPGRDMVVMEKPL